MNWLSNLWTNLWRASVPAASKPPEVMVTSAPAPAAPLRIGSDAVQLSKAPRLNLELTQGAPLGPLLISNNSAGLGPVIAKRTGADLTNSAPANTSSGPSFIPYVGTSLKPILSAVVSFWTRWGRPA